MKSILCVLLAVCFTFAGFGVQAQNGDRIIGVYKAVEEGKESKVQFTKLPDGRYRAQIIWLKTPNNPDGTPKLDVKNPDPAKRTLRADKAVIIESVKYDPEDQVWNDGRVYDPTKGKSYKVEVSFENPQTLRVKGSLLGFSKSVYWTKVE